MDGPRFTFLEGLPLTTRAAAFAADHHSGQRRLGDHASYLFHLHEVAALLHRSGFSDHLVAAAILHDVLEDTDASRRDLDAEFGREIGELVALVSDDPTIPEPEARKDDVRERVRGSGREPAVLYAADKVSKVRELRIIMAADGNDPEIPIRLARYRKSLAMLEGTIPDERIVAVLRFELEALEMLPPQQPPVLGALSDRRGSLVRIATALREELTELEASLDSPQLFSGYEPEDERWRQVFRLREQLREVDGLIRRLEDELYTDMFSGRSPINT